MVQRKGNVTSELYLRYIYTVSKVGYIYIKSVIPVTCTTGNWLRWVTDPGTLWHPKLEKELFSWTFRTLAKGSDASEALGA